MKVINWLFGGFFRTIGRTLAFLVMGALLYYLLSINDIGVKDLFFDNVKASTSERLFVSQLTINGEGVTVPSTGWYVSNNQYYIPMTTQNPTQGNWSKITYQFNELTFPANTKNFVTGLYIHNSDSLTQDYDYTAYSEGYQIYESGKNLYSLSLYYDGNTGFNYCNPVGNNGEFFYFSCPVMTTNFNKLILTIHTNKSSYNFASYFTFGLRSAFTLDIEGNNISDIIQNDNANTQAIINSQNQNTNAINNQTQQQHQDSQNTQNAINNGINQTIETITDNDLNDTEIENQLQFEVPSTSMGPFSGFITLPLTWVQNILAANQVCHKLELPLPFINKTLDLPCMQDFWSRMGLLSTLIQLCWLAVVGVRIFNGLYLLVVDIKSPNANADQLTKIRSWEL